MNAVPKDRTKREHVAQLDRVVWGDRDEPAVILALTDGHTAKGSADPEEFVRGVAYRFLGRWEEGPRGYQFRFQTWTREAAHSKPGVVKYLTDLAPGVGRITAERLWDRYGPEAVRVLREEPGRVSEDGVLRLDAALEASEALKRGSALEKTRIDLFGLLCGRGFSGKSIDRSIQHWGAAAPNLIKRNPFLLLSKKIPGAGFKRCDKLHQELGLPAGSLKRQAFALQDLLRNPDGHTWLDAHVAHKGLRERIPACDIRKAILFGRRCGMIDTRRVPADKLWLADGRRARDEARAARHLLRLAGWTGERLWPESLPVSRVEGDGLPSPHQAERAALATAGPVGVLCGSPGTGKTHTLAYLLRAVVAHVGIENVAVCAPTGKAAVRATQSLERLKIGLEATTIHRLLGITRNGHDGDGWGFEHDESYPLPCRVVIVDETSMVSTDLFADLLAACADGTHVLLIGDPYQLPPVGHGAPLRDVMASGLVGVGELTEVRRNAGQIVHGCLRIKNGETFDTAGSFDPELGHNLLHLDTSGDEHTLEVLEGLLTRLTRLDPVWQTQVIVARNEKGPLSRLAVNGRLGKLLNPDGRASSPNPFRVGDKVICTKNGWYKAVSCGDYLDEVGRQDAANYADVADWSRVGTHDFNYDEPLDSGRGGPREVYVANGEIGRVEAVGPVVAIVRVGEADLPVRVPVSRKRDDDEGEAGGGSDWAHAYGVTCHKMQGSEAPCVVIIGDGGAGQVADRAWLYTAVSRASKLCVLIGPGKVFDRMRGKIQLDKRKTFLTELLRGEQ